ncbi:MAG: Fic family protein [Lewinellaceae bacterium]|nr:Fic family protein [Lewinellaceae bacterium]
METVHTLRLSMNWRLIALLSKIDRFDAEWTMIEKREGRSLKQLKSVATVLSVGASTRIEGSKMSDQEVDVLLRNLKIEKLVDRDSQEVAGYYEVLDTILESFETIPITENSIKHLHNQLLRHSEKDAWHKGNYKQLSNNVEATMPDGSKQIVFQTTPPGMETEDAMRSLIQWYHADDKTHALVKCCIFCYEFVSIHPFQDGNGRLSRLLSSLLLLKHGYKWIQYVSFEHEIEHRKSEYYRILRSCQAQRPNEVIDDWTTFYLDALSNIQSKLQAKLEGEGVNQHLSPKEKSILVYISDHPGCRSGEIAQKLDIPSPTVKRILTELTDKNLISRFGSGPGTNYSIS